MNIRSMKTKQHYYSLPDFHINHMIMIALIIHLFHYACHPSLLINLSLKLYILIRTRNRFFSQSKDLTIQNKVNIPITTEPCELLNMHIIGNYLKQTP